MKYLMRWWICLTVAISAPHAAAENLLEVYEAAVTNDAALRAARAGFDATEELVEQTPQRPQQAEAVPAALASDAAHHAEQVVR